MGNLLQGSKDVIKEQNLGGRIDRPSQSDSSFLASTQCQSFLSNFCIITGFEEAEVASKTALVDDLLIAFLVIWVAEENVFLQSVSHPRQQNDLAVERRWGTHLYSFVLHPRLLSSVRDTFRAWEVVPRVRRQRDVVHFA